MPNPDDLLVTILQEVRSLGDAIELLASRGRLSRAERALLGQLVPQAASVVGNSVFAASDLHALPTLRELLDGYTPRATAWLFGRAEGIRIAGYRVERVGTDRGGALWQLRGEVTTSTGSTTR